MGRHYYFLLISVFLLFRLQADAQKKYSFSQAKMGSEMIITVDAIDTTGLSKSIFEAYQLTDDLVKIFSDYDPDSELNKVNLAPAHKPIKISSEMMILLAMSQDAFRQSGGAFDITLGKLTKAWRRTKATGIITHPDTLSWYKLYTGSHQFTIHPPENVLIKMNNQFDFDLGGIAKGYIADKVSKFLNASGWERHLIDAGGDMVAGDPPTGSCGWNIALELPNKNEVLQRVLCIKNQAVATSGSTYQHYIVGHETYSHIIQPKSGLGISKTDNVTVIAPTGADADWLATACSVLSWQKSKSLIKQFPSSTLIVTLTEVKNRDHRFAGKKIKFLK
ncbi:MAG: FAD:protein FMN transferase [Saprospiraceae bacterium]|nr:FAD:protein FMN transferase [Saprospiraceae bacterium]MBP6446986.1 FAD:protein FMN transferase [Saprospiraceae bacterium]